MEDKFKQITDDIDKIIKTILPHTGNFNKEVKLLSQKKMFFDMLDETLKKYDDLIKNLEQENTK